MGEQVRMEDDVMQDLTPVFHVHAERPDPRSGVTTFGYDPRNRLSTRTSLKGEVYAPISGGIKSG
jgi:hypothetical protein